MEQLMMILNSPFGLLVAGAIISGLLVQYITSKWQQRNWIFQQSFTTEGAKFERELEQRYKALESINRAVSVILTHSQLAVVGYAKGVPRLQMNEIKREYNEAVIEWETESRIWGIRLKTFFAAKELPAVWDDIRKQRDALDEAIHLLTDKKKGTPEDSLELIKRISKLTIDLSQCMLEEINNMKQRGLA